MKEYIEDCWNLSLASRASAGNVLEHLRKMPFALTSNNDVDGVLALDAAMPHQKPFTSQSNVSPHSIV
jgi:hypothetical protein